MWSDLYKYGTVIDCFVVIFAGAEERLQEGSGGKAATGLRSPANGQGISDEMTAAGSPLAHKISFCRLVYRKVCIPPPTVK